MGVVRRPCGRGAQKQKKNKIMANNSFRVDIPTNAGALIKLALAVQAQDDKLGAGSPLKAIKNWTNLAPLVDTADTQNTLADTLAKQAETATENRDLALGQSGQLRNNTVRFYVTAARDLLLGVNKGNEHALGDYGFTVDTSPSPAAVAKKAAKAAAKSQPAK